MQIDILLPNAKVYDVNKMDIMLGQTFSLLSDDTSTDNTWFSDNDSVLDITMNGNNASIIASQEGTSTILIMNSSFEVQKTLTIVVKKVLEVATSLGIIADAPVIK